MFQEMLPLVLLGVLQMMVAFLYGAYLLRRNREQGEGGPE